MTRPFATLLRTFRRWTPVLAALFAWPALAQMAKLPAAPAGERGRDVRRRLFLVHGAAVRQARRRARDDFGLHRRQEGESDLRGGLHRRHRPRRGGAGALRPEEGSYEKLLDVYWHNIDPTVKDRQFCDVGTQYRTSIFVYTDEQRRAAEASKAALEKSKPFKEAIVTPIVAATEFWPAEEYHQDYYMKNPLRYNYYRTGCGRDARLKQLWGSATH